MIVLFIFMLGGRFRCSWGVYQDFPCLGCVLRPVGGRTVKEGNRNKHYLDDITKRPLTCLERELPGEGIVIHGGFADSAVDFSDTGRIVEHEPHFVPGTNDRDICVRWILCGHVYFVCIHELEDLPDTFGVVGA